MPIHTMLSAVLTDGTDIVFLLKKQKIQTKAPQSAKRIAANMRISATDFVLIPNARYPILTQGKRLPHNAITSKDRIIVLTFLFNCYLQSKTAPIGNSLLLQSSV